jgi:hypothetical protein
MCGLTNPSAEGRIPLHGKQTVLVLELPMPDDDDDDDERERLLEMENIDRREAEELASQFD